MRSIVPKGWKSTLRTIEVMVNRERAATFALSWQVVGKPPISKTQGVLEFPFVHFKALTFK